MAWNNVTTAPKGVATRKLTKICRIIVDSKLTKYGSYNRGSPRRDNSRPCGARCAVSREKFSGVA
jgi:hypothetical protein